MEAKYKTYIIFGVILLLLSLAFFPEENLWANEDSKYLNAVEEFADNVLKYGRDTYGPKKTPLFVDGLNIHTHEPVKWISPKGDIFTATETEEWILSNFASQQTLLRTLDGLSTVTGDPKYRDAAKQAIKYAFENLRAPNGLLYWGHATAYDAQADKVKFGHPVHVLKVHYPYYELLWQVDQNATRKFIEAYWSGHVIDWSNLDFNRSALYSDSLEQPWNREYRGGPVFFKSKDSSGHGFFHTGTSLAHAGTTLYRLSGQEQSLVWSRRLIQRFVDTRHPNTGISAYKYNQPQRSFAGGDVTEQFKDPRTGVFPFYPFAVKRNMYHPEDVKMHQWLSVLLIGDMLGAQGREFTGWAMEELTAWGKVSYRERDNAFVPILTDGTHIEGIMLEEESPLGVKGSIAEPLFADAGYFWLYATAYRATDNEFMWQMTRNIVTGNNFGDIGEAPGQKPEFKMDTTCDDVYSLLGFLELYNKMKKQEFLLMAQRIADNIVAKRFHGGFFVLSKEHVYTRFDCFEPLALLHLAATLKSQSGSVPRVWPSSPLFVPPYRYKQEGEDRRIIYTLTGSSEVPFSLQEAAHIGNLDLVNTLLKNGINPDSLDDGFGLTALHRAASVGHRDIAELLITHGARVNHGGYKSTPMHCAIQYGHEDIVELLLAHGADVNLKDDWGRGQTPIDVAVRGGRREITELLQAKVAETSIHGAASLGVLAKVKAFLESGVDVNAKDNQGMTPLHLAAQGGHKEVMELLISKGADPNVKNSEGKTPEDIAAERQMELLIAVIVLAVPLIIGCILAIPLTFYLRIVADRPKRFFRYFVFLVAVFLSECAALATLLFFSSLYMLIPWLALTIIWGIIIGIWLRRRSSTKRVLKGAVAFAVYTSVPAVCIGIGIIITVTLTGREHILDGTGMLFPLNTILGSALTLGLGTLLLKVLFIIGEVGLLIRLVQPSGTNRSVK